MKTQYKGHGTLRVKDGADLSRSFLNVQASSYDHASAHGVRLMVSDPSPGGQILDVVLTPEDASTLGSLMRSLATSAVAKRQTDNLCRELNHMSA